MRGIKISREKGTTCAYAPHTEDKSSPGGIGCFACLYYAMSCTVWYTVPYPTPPQCLRKGKKFIKREFWSQTISFREKVWTTGRGKVVGSAYFLSLFFADDLNCPLLVSKGENECSGKTFGFTYFEKETFELQAGPQTGKVCMQVFFYFNLAYPHNSAQQLRKKRKRTSSSAALIFFPPCLFLFFFGRRRRRRERNQEKFVLSSLLSPLLLPRKEASLRNNHQQCLPHSKPN